MERKRICEPSAEHVCSLSNSFDVGLLFVTIPWIFFVLWICLRVYTVYCVFVILNSIGQFSTLAKTIVVWLTFTCECSTLHKLHAQLHLKPQERQNTHIQPTQLSNGWVHVEIFMRGKTKDRTALRSIRVRLLCHLWMLIEYGTIPSRYQVCLFDCRYVCIP